MQLTRLTTQFVEDEDRFLISADSENGIMNLWLTQRLLKRLLPHLIEWVGQGEAQENVPPEADKRKTSDIASAESTPDSSSHARQQAKSQLVAQYRNPVASVPAEKAVQNCLVRTLKFEPRNDVLRLVFVLPDDEAVLLMQEEHARIWLGVLYRHWQQAQWPDIWPDWMKEAQRMRLTAPVSLMH